MRVVDNDRPIEINPPSYSSSQLLERRRKNANTRGVTSQSQNDRSNYTKAINLWPYMGDAYFNRGLVLIYLKDKEKGCIDLSRAGELGVEDAYGVIKKYCEDKNKE